MADNKDLRDGRDRERVAGNEDYEISHLAQKLNVSAEEVRRAIEKVGNNREKLKNIYGAEDAKHHTLLRSRVFF